MAPTCFYSYRKWAAADGGRLLKKKHFQRKYFFFNFKLLVPSSLKFQITALISYQPVQLNLSLLHHSYGFSARAIKAMVLREGIVVWINQTARVWKNCAEQIEQVSITFELIYHCNTILLFAKSDNMTRSRMLFDQFV